MWYVGTASVLVVIKLNGSTNTAVAPTPPFVSTRPLVNAIVYVLFVFLALNTYDMTQFSL